MTTPTPEREQDVLNVTTLACDADKAGREHHPGYDEDAHYWRHHLTVTVEPSGRQLVW